jgi:hypothetical protein
MGDERSPMGLRDAVGIGFRAALAEGLLAAAHTPWSFIEAAPENLMGVGGRRGRLFAMAAERWPVVFHGLCGDLAGAGPLDEPWLASLRAFLRRHDARWYSDHLCLTHVDGGETHDLLPLPLSLEAADRAAARIRAVADRLELPIAVENVSAYLRPPVPAGEAPLTELDFICRVVEAADCSVLLDVNNVYVNSVNFGTNAIAFIDALPLERVVEIHVAGHHVEAVDPEGRPTLLLDTHGAPIADPVFALVRHTVARFRARGLAVPPILLERDHHLPPIAELASELCFLQDITTGAGALS